MSWRGGAGVLSREGGPKPRWGNRGGRHKLKWESWYKSGIWSDDDQL